ncbi:MAG: hypothetical protein EHM49_05275 [Deltaproteobacteria bacterium]|nr:MAG: hypothetical protein EHM49_05275 [Deltaproteobacteria bacterium]
MAYLSEDMNQIEFVKHAAKNFKENPEHASFGDTTPGSLLALRWGMGGDCILVLKIDEDHESTVYQQIIKKERG